MKIVAGRDRVELGLVPEAVVAVALDHPVDDAVGQRLHVLRHLGGLAVGIRRLVIGDPLALDRLAVDVEHAVDHLDLVARQADHPLDVVGRVVLGQLEHRDVAALRLGRPDPAVGCIGHIRQRQRVLRVAVGVFRDEQVVADQQRRHQRAGGDVERLEQQRAHHQGDEERLDADLQRLADAGPCRLGGFPERLAVVITRASRLRLRFRRCRSGPAPPRAALDVRSPEECAAIVSAERRSRPSASPPQRATVPANPGPRPQRRSRPAAPR